MWRTGRTNLAALVALVMAHGPAAAAGAADDTAAPRAVASNGAVVVMPDIAGMDCAAMSHVIRRLDMSKYRGSDPVPEGHRDWPIFVYEDRLSAAYYFSCTLSENRLADPGSAFSFGFEQN